MAQRHPCSKERQTMRDPGGWRGSSRTTTGRAILGAFTARQASRRTERQPHLAVTGGAAGQDGFLPLMSQRGSSGGSCGCETMPIWQEQRACQSNSTGVRNKRNISVFMKVLRPGGKAVA